MVQCPHCVGSFSPKDAHARGRLATAVPIQLDQAVSGGDDFDIQWMPPGAQSPVVFVKDEPRELSFTVKPQHAQALNVQLQRLRSRAAAGQGDLPLIDFNHDDGAASGRPTEMYWGGDDPQKGGIRLKGKWTASGKAAVTGDAPEFTRFSPEWYFGDNEEPAAISPNLGGLVNRAAFQGIATVKGKNAAPAGSAQDQVVEFSRAVASLIQSGESPDQALHLAKKTHPRRRTPDSSRNEPARLTSIPFQLKARALAAERKIGLDDAQVLLARSDFGLYQNFCHAVGKFDRRASIAETGRGGQKRFLRAVQAKQADGLKFEEAVEHVCGRQPNLYSEYRKSFH